MPHRRPSRTALRKIQLLLLDVDGVMTDGGIYFAESGDELKKFNIQDGYGIIKLQRSGIRVGIITGRVSKVVSRRAAELGITDVYQNLDNKRAVYDEMRAKSGLSDDQIAYIGDDEFDLPVLTQVGFSAAPADAVASVRRSVDYVCRRRGGEGAVREVADLLIDAMGKTTKSQGRNTR